MRRCRRRRRASWRARRRIWSLRCVPWTESSTYDSLIKFLHCSRPKLLQRPPQPAVDGADGEAQVLGDLCKGPSLVEAQFDKFDEVRIEPGDLVVKPLQLRIVAMPERN